MSVLYQEKHQTCFNYNMPAEAVFRVKDLPASDTLVRVDVEESKLVFLLEGGAFVKVGRHKPLRVDAGHFFYIPPHMRFYGHQFAPSKILTCTFRGQPQFCNIYSLESLADEIKERPGKSHGIYVLPVRGRLGDFLDLLEKCLADGLQCVHYHELKKRELFLLLRAYYTTEELARMFAPLLGMDHTFEELVMSRYKDVDTIEQFAELANMTVSTFQRKFKQTFYTPAGQWLMERKADRVMVDIRTSDKTMEQIAYDHGFSSLAYFSNFCKRMFGKSPTELRAERF